MINEKMTIKEIIEKYPEAKEIFIKHKIYCFSCPMASMETIKELASHGVDVKKIIKEIENTIKKK